MSLLPSYCFECDQLMRRLTELEFKLDKLKCCGNCKHLDFKDEDTTGVTCKQTDDVAIPWIDCPRWEIKE